MPKRTKGDPVDQYLLDGIVERIHPLRSSRHQPGITIRASTGKGTSVPLIPKRVIEQTSNATTVGESGEINCLVTQVDLYLLGFTFVTLFLLLADNVYSLGVLERFLQPYVARTPDPSFLGFVRGLVAIIPSALLFFRARNLRRTRSQQLVVWLFTVVAIMTLAIAISFEHTEIRSAVKQTYFAISNYNSLYWKQGELSR